MRRSRFAGFDYEFDFTKPSDVSKEERMKLYERLYHQGGLQFWLGTYMDILYQEEYNEEAWVIETDRNESRKMLTRRPDDIGINSGVARCFHGSKTRRTKKFWLQRRSRTLSAQNGSASNRTTSNVSIETTWIWSTSEKTTSLSLSKMGCELRTASYTKLM